MAVFKKGSITKSIRTNFKFSNKKRRNNIELTKLI